MARRLGTAALWMAMMWALLACSAPARWTDGRPDIYAPPPARPGAEGIGIQGFGVSTLHITDGTTSIMIDGFFSRPDLHALLTGPARPEPGRITDALKEAGIGRIDAVLVSHHHYDHALDAPWLALDKDALLFGPLAMKAYAKEEGYPCERFQTLAAESRFSVGNFEIEVFSTRHAKPFLLAELADMVQRWHGAEFRMDQNFSYILRHRLGSIAIISSAGGEADMLRGRQADVVLLGIGRLGVLPDRDIDAYWQEAVVKPGAQLVIPIHWDNFTRAYTETYRPPPRLFDTVDRAMARLHAVRGATPHIRLAVLPPFVPARVLPLQR